MYNYSFILANPYHVPSLIQQGSLLDLFLLYFTTNSTLPSILLIRHVGDEGQQQGEARATQEGQEL